jgi:putative oxidoreductase
MNALSSIGLLLARICTASVFILAGSGKLFAYDATIQSMAAKGMTMLPLMYVGALAVELGVGLALLSGFKTRLSAFVLLLFLAAVTYIFHDYWNASPDTFALQYFMFLKNIGIAGGLIAFISVGGGGISIDSCCRIKEKAPEGKPQE